MARHPLHLARECRECAPRRRRSVRCRRRSNCGRAGCARAIVPGPIAIAEEIITWMLCKIRACKIEPPTPGRAGAELRGGADALRNCHPDGQHGNARQTRLFILPPLQVAARGIGTGRHRQWLTQDGAISCTEPCGRMNQRSSFHDHAGQAHIAVASNCNGCRLRFLRHHGCRPTVWCVHRLPQDNLDRISNRSNHTLRRHARACRGHPRIACDSFARKTWMAGDKSGHDSPMHELLETGPEVWLRGTPIDGTADRPGIVTGLFVAFV